MGEPVPVYGQGFFVVSRGVITYIIVFDYLDEELYYQRLIEEGLVRGEEERLARNMQEIMDEERVIVNGEDVRVEVLDARVEVRGDPRRPSVTFMSIIPYRPRPGVNVYENLYEEDEASYDYTVYWIAGPCIEITGIESPGIVEHGRWVTRIFVRRGTRVTGYESVSFKIQC
ncbi:MAG: hypothetical protein GSR86_05785 [Desulfurococcales archaeon]|nr:hypothetical protein [Desulfurococcales archaeon]